MAVVTGLGPRLGPGLGAGRARVGHVRRDVSNLVARARRPCDRHRHTRRDDLSRRSDPQPAIFSHQHLRTPPQRANELHLAPWPQPRRRLLPAIVITAVQEPARAAGRKLIGPRKLVGPRKLPGSVREGRRAARRALCPSPPANSDVRTVNVCATRTGPRPTSRAQSQSHWPHSPATCKTAAVPARTSDRLPSGIRAELSLSQC